ncbi:F-box only protein 21-like [Nylanderia fulva]|uniref:F-box only protein 21-like n=1 Tax=Nylanderia fulva TaxID=613905 RepID=UPI0010FB1E86|nr:F-box only protein 21-like [Nylanderia fulva]
MATITSLPEELIPIILSYKDITIEDINNFRCVCQQFRYAASYSKYMEKKFSQRWPFLKKYVDILSITEDHEEYKSKKQIMNFIELGINYTRHFRKYVSQMKYMHYHNESIDNCVQFAHIFPFNPFERSNSEEDMYCDREFSIFFFYNDELKSLLTHSSRRTNCDLTKRYYYEKLFNYVKNSIIKLELRKFSTLSNKAQHFEWIAFNVVQTLQIRKDVTYAYVVESLDNIALEVQNYLKKEHPDHSIFSTSAETFSYWKNNNIDDNYWNEAEGIQIIDALDEYIFGKLNFRPCKVDDTNLEYMCIDNVLKSRYGQQIILLIIYQSVARRLGLRSDIVAFGDRFELSHYIYWKSRYGTINPRNERCYSLIFGKFQNCRVNKLRYREWLYFNRNNPLPSESFGRVSPCELRYKILLRVADLTYHYNNIFQIRQRNKIYSFHTSNFEIKVISLKRTKQFIRTKDVKFAVGMIVTHRDDYNNCDGVIIGWDRHTDRRYEFLTRNFNSSRWRNDSIQIDYLPLHHCDNYQFTKQQTNYIILTNDNKICYTNEGNLTLAAPKCIDNSEIGRYFCKFENTHYVPNEMLTKLYPEDSAVIT